MLQLVPQSRIFVAIEPADFRKGIDALSGVCRRHLEHNPLLCGEREYVAPFADLL